MKIEKKTKEITFPKLLAKAQTVFNKWIVARDLNAGCISCGGQVTQAGHYFSVGHHSSLRFSEMNTNGQDTRCNCFLHDNLINYREGLIKKYGEANVKLLELSAKLNRVKKWSRFELNLIINNYKI